MRVYVGGFLCAATREEIEALLATYGSVKRVYLGKDGEGAFRGFVFAEWYSDDNASKAMASLDGYSFQGRRLRAAPAKPRAT